jgi:tetratricopeptide (TPR) repeat protein
VRARIALLGSGDTEAARRTLDSAPLRFKRPLADLRLVVDAAEGRLEEGLERLRTLPGRLAERPLFIAPLPLLEAEYLALLGARSEARDRYSDARAELHTRLAEQPENYGLLLRLARASAALGLQDEAHAASRRAGELLPLHRDAYWGPIVLMHRAYVSSALGDAEEAIAFLVRLLEVPSFYSKRWIALDPLLQPLHGHPHFERVAKT